MTTETKRIIDNYMFEIRKVWLEGKKLSKFLKLIDEMTKHVGIIAYKAGVADGEAKARAELAKPAKKRKKVKEKVS